MTTESWIRPVHRWTSLVFTLTVAGIFLAMALGEPAEWVFFLPLPPLLVLVLSGSWLFLRPYLGRPRARLAQPE